MRARHDELADAVSAGTLSVALAARSEPALLAEIIPVRRVAAGIVAFPCGPTSEGSGGGVGKPADRGEETANARSVALVGLTVDTAQVGLFYQTSLDLQRS